MYQRKLLHSDLSKMSHYVVVQCLEVCMCSTMARAVVLYESELRGPTYQG